MGRDNNIYGLDENGMAERISGEALRPSGAKEDYHDGARVDQSARSKGNTPQYEDPDVVVKNSGGGNDSRAKTSGNHGKQD